MVETEQVLDATPVFESPSKPPINRLIVALISPALRGVARALAAQDADVKDGDDIAARVLNHVANILRALSLGAPVEAFPNLPEFEPTAFKTIFSDKRRSTARFWLEFSIPYLEGAGEALAMMDGDDTGIDDRIAVTLLYGAAILKALLEGVELPEVPEKLRSE